MLKLADKEDNKRRGGKKPESLFLLLGRAEKM